MEQKRVDEDLIVWLEKEWADVFTTGDYARGADLMTDDFVYITFLGRTLNKSELLNSYRSGERSASKMEVTERTISLYDGCAISRGLLTLEGVFAGIKYEGPTRYTRVWVSVGGEYKVASLHTSDARALASFDHATQKFKNTKIF